MQSLGFVSVPPGGEGGAKPRKRGQAINRSDSVQNGEPMTERSEQVWQNLHNALEKKASEAELLRDRVAELEAQTPSALKAKLESAEARIAELEAEGRFSGTWADYHEHMNRKVGRLEARIAELDAQSEELARIADEHVNTVHRYRDALERLARLGNEPCYGNSIGNRIAQDALGIEVGLNA